MKKNIIFFSILILLLVFLLLDNKEDSTDELAIVKDIELSLVIIQCENITEKSAANLTAIVEFQKLEIEGRKAHVFKTCMQDRGYNKNPKWDDYIASITKKLSRDTDTSMGEAYENLTRIEMKLSQTVTGQPFYWLRKTD